MTPDISLFCYKLSKREMRELYLEIVLKFGENTFRGIAHQKPGGHVPCQTSQCESVKTSFYKLLSKQTLTFDTTCTSMCKSSSLSSPKQPNLAQGAESLMEIHKLKCQITEPCSNQLRILNESDPKSAA